MQRKKKGDVEWLEFEQLTDVKELVHGVFLRHGGVSKDCFSSLNVGGGTGDAPQSIIENREKICAVLGVKELISRRQTHGINIEFLPSLNPLEEDCDGLITKQKNMGLMIKHADCQAAIFYDPIEKVIANIHCGWRGNVKNIYAEAVRRICEEGGSKPENLLVCISPSLGPDWAEFKNYQIEFPESFWTFQVRPTYFDLWAISHKQLTDCGVLPHHIEIASLCTYSDSQDFYSYRRDKSTGRHATVIALK
jgi:polyphenol oxidase